MAKGDSGRIVVELEPSVKRQLYSSLALENKTLKDWMIERIEQYIAEGPTDNKINEARPK